MTTLTSRQLIRSRTVRVLLLLATAISLSGTKKNAYGPRDKAYYLDPALIQYANPGLTITVNSASISNSGTITVNYTIADPTGLPLDAAGLSTPGTVSLSFVAAVLPNGQEQYTTYTTRTATGTVIGSVQPPGAAFG